MAACLQRNVIKYTFTACLVPSLPGNTHTHPAGEELLLLPIPVIFPGSIPKLSLALLDSAWLQESEYILLFPPLQASKPWKAKAGLPHRGTCAEQGFFSPALDSLAPCLEELLRHYL